jgi:hypothetical protein
MQANLINPGMNKIPLTNWVIIDSPPHSWL